MTIRTKSYLGHAWQSTHLVKPASSRVVSANCPPRLFVLLYCRWGAWLRACCCCRRRRLFFVPNCLLGQEDRGLGHPYREAPPLPRPTARYHEPEKYITAQLRNKHNFFICQTHLSLRIYTLHSYPYVYLGDNNVICFIII
jgi:hypothetical protein